MNKEFVELNKKKDDEICALIVRLKSQLLESRFKMAMGEVNKTHVLSQIRNTIQRCMYILNTRGLKITTGSHGVYLINVKDNKVTNMTEKVNAILAADEQKAKKLEEEAKAKAEAESKKKAEEKAKKGKLTETTTKAEEKPAKEAK